MRDATAIWTRTIGACSVVPLAGIAVSRHFCHLAQNVLDGGRDDPNDLEAVERFLDQQAAVQSELSNEGRTACPDVEFERLCEHGFRTVRFFDLVSLWLCCADRQEPTRLAGPRGDEVTFVPQSMSRIAIEPYPLTVEPHELHVSVRRIASRRYLNDEDLQQALRNAPTRCLDWTLCSS